MRRRQLVLLLGLVTIGSPTAARPAMPAPAGTPTTRYCMRIEAVTGTRLETVKCWTRQEWAEQGVDVDTDWPKEGVAIID